MPQSNEPDLNAILLGDGIVVCRYRRQGGILAARATSAPGRFDHDHSRAFDGRHRGNCTDASRLSGSPTPTSRRSGRWCFRPIRCSDSSGSPHSDAAAFRMPDSLWARIVYDFLLAYRLRTINRGHLLGALIPLYLAWVASHLNITASGSQPRTPYRGRCRGFRGRKALPGCALALAGPVQPMKNHAQELSRYFSLMHRSEPSNSVTESRPARVVSGTQSKRIDSRSESYAYRPCHHAPDNDLSGPAAADG